MELVESTNASFASISSKQMINVLSSMQSVDHQHFSSGVSAIFSQFSDMNICKTWALYNFDIRDIQTSIINRNTTGPQSTGCETQANFDFMSNSAIHDQRKKHYIANMGLQWNNKGPVIKIIKKIKLEVAFSSFWNQINIWTLFSSNASVQLYFNYGRCIWTTTHMHTHTHAHTKAHAMYPSIVLGVIYVTESKQYFFMICPVNNI